VLIIFGESAASRLQIVVNKNARSGRPCGRPYFYSLETKGASFTSETTQRKLFAPDVQSIKSRDVKTVTGKKRVIILRDGHIVKRTAD